MLQGQYHCNLKQSEAVGYCAGGKTVRERVAQFNVSKGTVPKTMSKCLYILQLSDDRKRIWCWYEKPIYAELLPPQREVYGEENVRIFRGGILIMLGQSWCILIGHWMSQYTMKNPDPSLDSFWRTATVHQQCGTYYSILFTMPS